MKINSKNAAKAGFSLVEMLVVIAVIGIIAAIAVPNIGRINDSAKDATYRRNAQNLASVFASAQAAGHDFSNGGKRKEKAIIQQMITGATINDADSPFNGTYFGVPGLDATDAVSETDGAAKYLQFDAASQQLLYTGGQ
ncbi:MAG: prepilin-type N-terminal cleavage/methylation domain-containing protein [Verrucomicrobiales bacterium]|nr:prepilin-type N-terminal cleavage/methylation domain-containing protein [Verrucomicrobiales bacterium]